MINIIENYFYIIVAIVIAVVVSVPYWKALKLSRAQKAKHPFPRSVLVVATIGVILGIILGVVVLKYTVSGWEDIFPPLFFTLFFFGTLLGLVVALKAGAFSKAMQPKGFFDQGNPESLALPVETSWALTSLAFIWGTIGGLLGSMILIVVA